MTIRSIRFILFCFSLLFIVSSCKKINETTDIGGDVIPGADGVTTFDTTLTSLQTFNHIFDATKDSAIVGLTNNQILGNISNDPLFGKTNAKMFLQLKPEVYPWSFSGVYNKDSLYIDSVVLVLGWNGSYGDTNTPQKVNVKEIDLFSDFRVDSFLTIRDPGPATTTLLGTKTFNPSNLKDTVKAYQDTTTGQLRVRLDNSFGRRLLDYDTAHAYANDSAFNTYFKGFAIEADQSVGNALMAFGIYQNPKTKLAIYYRYTKGGKVDTTVNYFLVKPGSSANHNYVNRFDFAGTPLLAASNTPAEDDLVYIINTPGSYATIKIPALRDLSNRIIHRAELIVEQVYSSPFDNTFTVPQSLMLDVYDSTLGDYKFVPFDFNPDASGNVNPGFGLYGQNTVDGVGNPIRVWKFDITRYVQNVLTKQEPLHDFRLFTTQTAVGWIRNVVLNNTGPYRPAGANLNTNYAFGRVKVGGGNHPTQKMRLRLVYSKI
ncbi:MAG TPA: DUF4270 family protein [Chitinophagaceae bacterium]|nr:DUF4270 family protein [Chitinophagaceae bacterium]